MLSRALVCLCLSAASALLRGGGGPEVAQMVKEGNRIRDNVAFLELEAAQQIEDEVDRLEKEEAVVKAALEVCAIQVMCSCTLLPPTPDSLVPHNF